jgi:hypothetical protein
MPKESNRLMQLGSLEIQSRLGPCKTEQQF